MAYYAFTQPENKNVRDEDVVYDKDLAKQTHIDYNKFDYDEIDKNLISQFTC